MSPVGTDGELGRLEARRAVLYQKLADITRKHKETSTDIRVEIYEIESRLASIYRGDS